MVYFKVPEGGPIPMETYRTRDWKPNRLFGTTNRKKF